MGFNFIRWLRSPRKAQPVRRKPRQFRPEIERLEQRWLMTTVMFSASTYTVNENAGNETISVDLSASSASTVSVGYATSDGTAKAGIDYTATSGGLSFPPGTTVETFLIPITDGDTKGNKTVNLTLSSPINATLGSPSTAVLTINYVTPTTWTTLGQQPSADPQQGVVVPVGDAEIDPVAGNLTVQIPLDFQQSTTGPQDDWTDPGGDPALVYNLNTVPLNSTMISPVVVDATFASDPTQPVPAQIQARLSWNNAAPQAWTTYTTTGHSTGDTYLVAQQVAPSALYNTIATSGRYPWTMEIEASFSTRGMVDRHVSGFADVVVNSATGGDALGTGWSLSGQDSLMLRALSLSDAIVLTTFTATNAVFTVYLSNTSTQPVTVHYATADGTGGNGAKAGTDYTATSGTLTIAAGSATATITVPVLGNMMAMGTRTFSLVLTNPTNAGIARGLGTGTLVAGGLPGGATLTVGNAMINEGTGSNHDIFTLLLDGANASAVTVPYSTADGNAIAGTDYTATSGILTIAAGSTSGTISVPILQDTAARGNLIFYLNLGPASNTGTTSAQAIGTIVDDDDTDVLIAYAGGGSRYFKSLTGTTFTSPANDFGTLVKSGNNYIYTSVDQNKWTWDNTGTLITIADPHGLLQTFTYSNGRLSTVTEPDGGIATFSYDGNNMLAKIQEPGNRTVTVTETSGTLTNITNPDGSLRTFTYDSVARMLTDTWSPSSYGFLYGTADGLLTEVSWGLSIWKLSAEATQGFTTTPILNASQDLAVITDPLSRVTTYSLDSLGRATEVFTPDGFHQTYSLNSAGLVTVATDSLNRVTSYAYNSSGDLTEITYPDSSTEQFQYDPTFQEVTVYTDPDGHLTTSTYDPSTGDLLTVTDALHEVTTYTWSNGLEQTVTDALNHTTTYQYFSGTRRIEDIVDALNDRTTFSYDGSGNATVVEDPLGHLVTTTFDGMRRPLSVQDAAGMVTMSYNALGELTGTTDQLGRQTTFSYDLRGLQSAMTEAVGTGVQRTTIYGPDAVGNITVIEDALNNLTTYVYDVMDRATVTIDALSNRTTSLVDAVGNVTEIIDPNNNITKYQYDFLDRLTGVIDASGQTTSTLYDAAGNTTEVIDPASGTTQWQYDPLNRASVTIDAMGNHSTTLFDQVGNVTETIDPNGNITKYQYDALNRLTGVIDAGGNLTATLYDKAGNVTETIDPNTHATQYVYDAANRLTVTIDALGNTTTSTLDAAGNVTETTDANHHTTQYEYDALNRLTVTIDANSKYTTTLFDKNGNVTETIDALGNITKFTVDALNRVTVTTDANSGVTSTLFDPAGNVTETIDARNNASQYQYDALNRLTATIDPLLNETKTLYDTRGNVTETIDANNNATQYEYDALNRVTGTINAAGNHVTTLYDKNGNVTETIDGNTNATQYEYDALNRLTVTIDALNNKTTTLFDAVGNVTSVTDADMNVTKYSYDALNRLTQTTDPFNHTVTSLYDAVGNLTSTTDQLGRVQDFSYDPLNRMTTAVWLTSGVAVNTLTYAFDADGNILNAANLNGAYTLSYDVLNRVSAVQEPFGQTLTFTYDPNGNRTLVTDSQGGATTSVYDKDNNLTSRQFSGNSNTLRFDMTYTHTNQLGTVTRYSDLAGTTKVGASSYTYDAVERVSAILHTNGSGTTLANFTYTYDAASNLKTEKANGTTQTFTYDNTNQLTGDGIATNTYDATGNRTTSGYTTGTDNQLTNDGTWTYSYDAVGNLEKKTKGTTAETWTYGYDTLNHMVWAEDRATDGGTLISRETFLYDVFGNRIEEDVTTGSTVVTRFALDGWKAGGNVASPVGNSNWDVWADMDGSNNLLVRYVNGDAVDQHFARVTIGGTNAGVAWYLTDWRGSSRNLTDATGTLKDTITYDGFGNVISESSASFGDRYKFTGRELDSMTGLQYNRDRYYDPRIGRWTSEDPSGLAAGDANLYRYVGNRPTNATDPSGLLELSGLSVGHIQKGGLPGYQINWNILIDAKKPAGATQVWIITKIESWSVYKMGDGKWQVWPKAKTYKVVYKGDFIDIGNRKRIGDISGLGYDPKKKYEWAIYFEKVTKTLGYNPKGGAVDQARNVILTQKQAKSYLNKMENSTEDLFQYYYLYVNKANRALSGIDIDSEMPPDMKKELQKLSKTAKRFKKPYELENATGFYLSSPWIPIPTLRHREKE